MPNRNIPPSIVASLRLDPEDVLVISYLAEQHAVTPAEVIRWAVRRYALDPVDGLPDTLADEPVREWLESQPNGPARYVPADPKGQR